MKKRFNITGICYADEHYMADVSGKFEVIRKMVEQGAYFTINRPRQYGKTTTLSHLLETLNRDAEYLTLSISFEGLGSEDFHSEKDFCNVFLQLLQEQSELNGWSGFSAFIKEASGKTQKISALSQTITSLLNSTSKKVVLLIDEVDKSSNNQLFLDFLGMLRQKFLTRKAIKTFHSVVLAGVYDVKSLKLKLRPDAEQKYNSPWNIAADFKVDMNFYPPEIKPMLDEYAADRGVQIDTRAVAERLFYYTSGYPFLVSKLCKMFDEEMLPEKSAREWTVQDVDTAASRLVTETNTNFETLIKNLENYPELYQLTHKLVIQAEQLDFNIHDPVVSLGMMYGIFSNGRGLNIHNRIYREIIANYMTFQIYRTRDEVREGAAGIFTLPDNRLDVEKAITRFQAFMKEEYSKQDRDFLERQGRLLFLAFLKPILNGHGYSFKEPQISEERRLDVVITFYQRRYVAELKVWRGEAAHQRGLAQLAGYLDGLGLTEGFLVVFDHGAVKSWRQEWADAEGKRIFAVWV